MTTDDVTVFECSNCGGNLEFRPGAGSLECPFCGTRNDLPTDATPEIYEELDYRTAVRNLETSSTTVQVRLLQCSGCGAGVTLQPTESTSECPYCGTHVVSESDPRSVLQPQYILPFALEVSDGAKRFRKWISTRRFAPKALKQYTRVSEPLSGIYYPFWTYDSDTTSKYSGMRGVYYRETVRTTNSEGKTVTRTVTKTRWYPAAGTVSRVFDDVLVPASESLEPELVAKAKDFPLGQLVDYDSRYLSGFRGETYSVDLEEGFAEAKSIMDRQIRADVRADIGGNAQRITSLHTRHRDVTFKYIVMPFYALKYKFREKYFPVIINGVTGTVAGKRPVSWFKIVLTALIAAGIAVGGYFLLRYVGVV